MEGNASRPNFGVTWNHAESRITEAALDWSPGARVPGYVSFDAAVVCGGAAAEHSWDDRLLAGGARRAELAVCLSPHRISVRDHRWSDCAGRDADGGDAELSPAQGARRHRGDISTLRH